MWNSHAAASRRCTAAGARGHWQSSAPVAPHIRTGSILHNTATHPRTGRHPEQRRKRRGHSPATRRVIAGGATAACLCCPQSLAHVHCTHARVHRRAASHAWGEPREHNYIPFIMVGDVDAAHACRSPAPASGVVTRHMKRWFRHSTRASPALHLAVAVRPIVGAPSGSTPHRRRVVWSSKTGGPARPRFRGKFRNRGCFPRRQGVRQRDDRPRLPELEIRIGG